MNWLKDLDPTIKLFIGLFLAMLVGLTMKRYQE